MTISRRSLLSRSAFLLAGGALWPSTGWAATVGGSAPGCMVPLSPADQTVLAWVQSYASAVRLAGSGVVGKLRQSAWPTTFFLARIEQPGNLTAALAGPLPFDGAPVFTQGNTCTVSFAGTEFTIRNLLPADFAKALTARRERVTTSLATDGVTWDPVTHALSDPFHATGVATLKLVNPGGSVVVIFANLLRSLSESEAANVEPDVSFRAYWRRALNRNTLRPMESAAVVAELIRALPEVTVHRTPQQVAALLETPLVATSLRRELGLSAAAVVAQHASLRAARPGTVSEAAVWLAALLAPDIRAGTASVYAGGLAPEKQGPFLAALAEAQQLV